MLSLRLYETNPSAAEHRLESTARTLEERFNRFPDEERTIINEAAYKEIVARPEIVARFPANIRTLFTDHDSFAIFNVVRSMYATSSVVAAYMVRESALKPERIEGRIVPVDEAAAIYVNDSSLGSRDLVQELRDTRASIEQIERDYETQLQQLTAKQQREITATARFATDTVIRTYTALQSRHLLVSAFAHQTITTELMRTSPVLLGVMQTLTRVANAIYQSMLTREPVSSPLTYINLALGNKEINFPDTYDEAHTQVRRFFDGLSFMGDYSFHNIIGHRWLLLQLPSDKLLERSDLVDARLAGIAATMPQEARDALFIVFQDTFPRQFVFNLAGQGNLASRDMPIKQSLFEAVLAYFTLSDNLVQAVNAAASWWTTKVARLFAPVISIQISENVARVGLYQANVSQLTESDGTEAYLRFFDDDFSFETSVAPLFRYTEGTLSSVSLESKDFVSPAALSNYISKLGSYEERQQELFSTVMQQLIDDQTGKMGDSSLINSLLTEVRTILSLVRRHAKTADVLISAADDSIDLRDVSTTDLLLKALGTNESVAKTTFFPLSKLLLFGNEAIETLMLYYLRIHFYYECKSGVLSAVPEDNYYFPLLKAMHDEEGTLLLLDAAFNANMKVEWRADDYIQAVSALRSRRLMFNLDELRISVPAESTLVWASVRDTIGGWFQLAPRAFSLRPTTATPGTPAYLRDITVSTLFALDALQGGMVSHTGEIMFDNLCAFDVGEETFHSLYMACLLLYFSNVRENIKYIDTKLFDVWRCMVDHIDNCKRKAARTGAPIYRSYELNEELEPLENVPPFQLSEVLVSTPQHVIEFVSEDTMTVPEIVYGKKQYFVEMKWDLYRARKRSHQLMLHSWLSLKHLQTPSLIEARGFWLMTKKVLLSMSDANIVKALYGAASWTEDPPSTAVVNTLVRKYLEKKRTDSQVWIKVVSDINRARVWAAAQITDRVWTPDMLDKISEFAASPEILLDVQEEGVRRTYNEYKLVHHWHATQQYGAMLQVARLVMFSQSLRAYTFGYVQQLIDKLAAPRLPGSLFANLNTFKTAFAELYDVGASQITDRLTLLINNTALSASDLLTVCFLGLVVFDSGLAQDEKWKLVIPIEPVEYWRLDSKDDHVRYLFQTAQAKGVERSQILSMIFALRDAPDQVELFRTCLVRLRQVILSGLFGAEPEQPSVVVDNKGADDAVNVIFDITHAVAKMGHSRTKQHLAHQDALKLIGVLFDVGILGKAGTRMKFLQDVSTLRNSTNYEASVKDVPFFGIIPLESTKAAFGESKWRERMTALCDAVIFLCEYAETISVWQQYTAYYTVSSICDLYMPPGQVMADFINPENNTDAMCIYDLVFSQEPVYSDEDRPPDIIPLNDWHPYELRRRYMFLFDVSRRSQFSLSSLVTRNYFFAPPSIVHVVYLLSIYQSFIHDTDDIGWKKFCMSQYRQNGDRMIDLPSFFNKWSEFGFFIDKLPNSLEEINNALNRTVRGFPPYILWKDTLGALIEDLMTWDTRATVTQEWAIHMQRTIGHTSSIIQSLEKRVMQRLSEKVGLFFDQVLNADIFSKDDDENRNRYYRVLLHDNPLLLNAGVHRHLGLLFSVAR